MVDVYDVLCCAYLFGSSMSWEGYYYCGTAPTHEVWGQGKVAIFLGFGEITSKYASAVVLRPADSLEWSMLIFARFVKLLLRQRFFIDVFFFEDT